ncbi:MAG: ABC transporter permease [Lachnospiraceae bacterium]
MSILQAFKLAVTSIFQNKMRSFLTMLGMIIGVGAVIALISVVQGFSDEMMATFEELGTNQVVVRVMENGNKIVTEDDMFEFAEENSEYFLGVSPTVSVSAQVKVDTDTVTTTSITGVAENYAELKDLELSSGRFLQYADVLKRHRYCVVGSYIVSELFDGQNPIGERIKLNQYYYEIVGVLKEESDSEEGSSDDAIYIPYTTACDQNQNRTINSYYMSAVDTDTVEDAKTVIEDFLYSYYVDEDYYRVTTLVSMLDQIDQIMGMMSTMLGGIAGISLLVAGIGIMNIMLVSVSERTREIGIRKSMGARKKDIMRQFVLEAGATSSIGGVLGIILGCILTRFIGNVIGMNANATMSSILMSFGISVAIGVIFGYMPANKAANLNPIDALRSE